MTDTGRWLYHLNALYESQVAQSILPQLLARVEPYRPVLAALRQRSAQLSERDAMLITYGDQVRQAGAPPLRALAEFASRHLAGIINCIHILPFFPYSSDDGFSVIDYRQANPELGGWDDISRLGKDFRLMFDAVINHVSSQSAWFQGFLRDAEAYRGYFIVVNGNADLSQVVRPRALPLLTAYGSPPDTKMVWTTFSADQVDLNYQNPEVLLEIIDLMLFYVAHGAEFIRLDAIAYLWKKIGTPCIHLPETHHVVRLFRAVLDEVAPYAKLITETNVPHQDNIAYFGDGTDEAHLIYNFALPPLILHAFRTSTARALAQWAGALTLPSDKATFFNFLASHDGIGLNPARNILTETEIEALVQQTLAHGGLVSYKQNPDGSQSPYELNISYFDALSDPASDEPLAAQVDRFIAAQAIMLSLVGLPGIYFHSLFGSRSWREGAAQTGHNRTINRQKLDRAPLEDELADGTSLRHQVFTRYARLLKARASSPAFHPYGQQKVFDCGEAIFALLRISPVNTEKVLCLQNVSGQCQPVLADFGTVWGTAPGGWRVVDLITGQRLTLEHHASLQLGPYQTWWLAKIEP